MNNNDNSKPAFIMSLNDYIRIIELAEKHGKKPGDSMEEEFFQVLQEKGNNIKLLGDATDPEILKANLREHGIGVGKDKLDVLDLRKKKYKKTDNVLTPDEYRLILEKITEQIYKGLPIKSIDTRMDLIKGVVTKITLNFTGQAQMIFDGDAIAKTNNKFYNVIIDYLNK